MIDFTLRGEPEDINCPYCFKKQRTNIYEATEVWDEEGEFKMECETCDKKFVVNYEYIPSVQTLTIDEEEKEMNNDKKILQECGYDEETLNSMTEEDIESEVDLLSSDGM